MEHIFELQALSEIHERALAVTPELIQKAEETHQGTERPVAPGEVVVGVVPELAQRLYAVSVGLYEEQQEIEKRAENASTSQEKHALAWECMKKRQTLSLAREIGWSVILSSLNQRVAPYDTMSFRSGWLIVAYNVPANPIAQALGAVMGGAPQASVIVMDRRGVVEEEEILEDIPETVN